MEPVLDNLGKFKRRVGLLLVWQGLAMGLALGAVLACVWAVLDWAGVWYTDWPQMLVVVAALGVLGAVWGAVRNIETRSLADSIDRRASLKNRLGAALSTQGEWAESVREDAQTHVAELQPNRIYPVRFGRWHKAALAGCAVAAAVFILGNSPLLLNDKQKAERKELQAAAVNVERVAKPVLEDPTDTETKRLAESVNRLAMEMQRGKLEKPEALQTTDELSRQADELAKERFKETERLLDEAQTAHDRAMQGAEDARKAEALESELQDLKAQLEKAGSKAEADKLKAQIQQKQQEIQQLKLSKEAQETFQKLMAMPEYKELMEMARKLKNEAQAGQQGNQKLTEEQLKQMQERMEELAKALKDEAAMKEYLKKLREAMEKAEGG